MEGELTIIDNLSGSIFHHYSSPAGCEKCHHDKQEVAAAGRRLVLVWGAMRPVGVLALGPRAPWSWWLGRWPLSPPTPAGPSLPGAGDTGLSLGCPSPSRRVRSGEISGHKFPRVSGPCGFPCL